MERAIVSINRAFPYLIPLTGLFTIMLILFFSASNSEYEKNGSTFFDNLQNSFEAIISEMPTTGVSMSPIPGVIIAEDEYILNFPIRIPVASAYVAPASPLATNAPTPTISANPTVKPSPTATQTTWATATPTPTNENSNSGTSFKYTDGIKVHNENSKELSGIDWGAVSIGSISNYRIYVTNVGQQSVTLVLSVTNWTPGVNGVVSWDYDGTAIPVGDTLQITLSLVIKDATVSSFGNNIVISSKNV